MAKATAEEVTSRPKPALTPEAREKQLISAAMNEAERRILDGTASSQIICHFLKLGSTRNELELEKMRRENKMIDAKTEALESAKHVEELYTAAMNAFRGYGNYEDIDDAEDYDQDI